MCGVLVAIDKNQKIDLKKADGALDKLKLRGPDFSFRDVLCQDHLYFGQTVLSITGEPMDMVDRYHRSGSGRYNLVFNGEIYNHKELYKKFLAPRGIDVSSKTDTETLVNLHEVLPPEEVYNSLRGMFAYLVYDRKKNSLLIGRDRIGEKVLYYYEDDRYFLIASEIGPILELVPEVKIDRDALREYFFTRHLLTARQSVFQGIKLIPPGSLLEYDLNSPRLVIVQSKTLADFIDGDLIEKNKQRPVAELAGELESVFRTSALEIAPERVPFVSVFSGGVDSSLASLFMSRAKKPAHYAALQFPGKDKVSENLQAFEKTLGGKIETKIVDIDLYRSFFDDVYRTACSPLPTHSFLSQAIVGQFVRELGAKVWIGGHGGDEVFGGYELYKKFGELSDFPETNPSPYSGFVDYGFVFAGWSPKKLQNDIAASWQEFSKFYAFEADGRQRAIQTALYTDLVIMLESVGIREADTMSMLSSVEPRCFYLTQDVLRFGLNLPAAQKVDVASPDPEKVTRPLIKEVFVRQFGRELLRPKQGFSGFPNEAGRTLVTAGFPLVKEHLGLKDVPVGKTESEKTAIEWKLINTELFLMSFARHL